MPLLIILAVVVAFFFVKGKGATAAGVSPLGVATPQPGPVGSVVQGSLDDMSEAIARFEGFYTPGSLPNRTNNPGMVGGDAYKGYSDSGDGWDALSGWITRHASAHPEWDFYDTMHYYLTGDTMGAPGPGQASPDAYAEYVSNYMGVDPTQTVSSTLGG